VWREVAAARVTESVQIDIPADAEGIDLLTPARLRGDA
jgi:hypothetical protein